MKKYLKKQITTLFRISYFYRPNETKVLLKNLSKTHKFFLYHYLIVESCPIIFKNAIEEYLTSNTFFHIVQKSYMHQRIAAALNDDPELTNKFKINALHDIANNREHYYIFHLKLASKLQDPSVLKSLANCVQVLEIQSLKSAAAEYTILNDNASNFTFNFPLLTDSSQRTEELTLKSNTEYIARIEKGIVTPGLCVIKDNKYIISDPSAHPKYDEVSGIHSFISGNSESNSVIATFNTEITDSVESGILIAGRNSSNYFHWLIEYLPRLQLVINYNLDKSFTILIPTGLYPQLREALDCINPGYPIHQLNDNACTMVQNLIIPSFYTNIPDRYDIPFWKSSLIAPKALDFIKNKIISHLNITKASPYKSRIFLSRHNSKARAIINKNQVERLFELYNYQKVYTEDLSFLDQVLLFRSTEFIAGPGGAALSNLIFCKENTKIVSLISEANKEFCLHSNLASLSKSQFYYHCSKLKLKKESFAKLPNYYHSSFKVDIKSLKKFLNKLHS